MPRTSVRILAAAIVAVLLLANAPAQATAISKNFNATASVAANCQMSAVGDLSFGAYDPVVANATSGLSGNTSFTPIFCAASSARCRRFDRETSAWVRSACPMLVPNRSV